MKKIIILLMLAVLAGSGAALAQLEALTSPSAASGENKPAAPVDPLGRETPEGMVQGFIAAVAARDYEKAGRYLNLTAVPKNRRDTAGPELARQLQKLLERGGYLYARWQLSDQPTGHADDGLAANLERFGTIRTEEGAVDLLAERVEDPGAGLIWLVSASSVAAIPKWQESVAGGVLDRMLPQTLSRTLLWGVPVGHWLALILLVFVAYGVAWALTRLGRKVLWLVWPAARSERGQRLQDAVAVPLRIYLGVWIFAISAIFLGVSVVARQQIGRLTEILGWLTLAWLVWRIVDALADVGAERMARQGRSGAVAAVVLVRRIGKAVLMAIVVVALLDNLGFDVTAGLAALGIGGIAIALGAQKTVENLVGSLMLIADQPVRVGEVCTFTGITGTVEDIGMRSTRVRTLDRTVVSIPNGEFSSLKLENLSRRDRFWFHPTIGLRYETTPDQIRYLLVELRAILYAHPRVSPDPARVRFTGFGSETLNIEVFAYVHATDYSEYLEVQEDLNLRFMDAVASSGTTFAFPSRTIYLGKDTPPSGDRALDIGQRVKEWTDKGELQVPRFDSERIVALRDTIQYPGPGTAAAKRAERGTD